MFGQLTKVFSLGAVIFLSSNVAQAQYGGLSIRLGGYGYGNSNYRNYGYNYPTQQSYYPSYGNYNNGYYNNGYYNNGYYNNNLNGGYVYRSPNYYVAPQRVYPARRYRRW